MTTVLSALYFAPIEYFYCIRNAEKIIIDINEPFEKQSYRNRCKILGPNKIQNLIVPVQHPYNKRPIKDLKIDYSDRWTSLHTRSIQSAYGKAPFFDFFYSSLIEPIEQKPVYLIDLNLKILTNCLKILRWSSNILFTEKFEFVDSDGFIDYRKHIHPKKQKLKKEVFMTKGYQQLFGKEFVPNLSIIDLLMTSGPQATDIIENTRLEH